jgi:hypothetical protein
MKFSMESFDSYIKQMVQSYASFQVMQGYEPGIVAATLAKYGLKQHHIGQLLARPATITKRAAGEDFEMQTYYYLKGTLADYVKEKLDSGVSVRSIETELSVYGFHKGLIKEVLKFVQPPKIEFKVPHGILYIAAFIWVLSIVFFLAYTLNQDILIILMSFFPTLISLILLFIFFEKFSKKRLILPFATTFLSAVLVAIIVPNIGSDIEVPIVVLLNAALTFMASLFIALFYRDVK